MQRAYPGRNCCYVDRSEGEVCSRSERRRYSRIHHRSWHCNSTRPTYRKRRRGDRSRIHRLAERRAECLTHSHIGRTVRRHCRDDCGRRRRSSRGKCPNIIRWQRRTTSARSTRGDGTGVAGPIRESCRRCKGRGQSAVRNCSCYRCTPRPGDRKGCAGDRRGIHRHAESRADRGVHRHSGCAIRGDCGHHRGNSDRFFTTAGDKN